MLSQSWSLLLTEDICLLSGWSGGDYMDFSTIALRLSNGYQIWASQDFQLVGSSGRVVYGYSSQPAAVSAHDARSNDFDELWVLYPPDGFHADEMVVSLAAHHLVAVSHYQVYAYLWVVEN